MVFRGRGRGRGGGGRGHYDEGPPEEITRIGRLLHTAEGDLVLQTESNMVPYFNAPIYLENKEKIGKIDEIFGPINEYLMSVKLEPNMQASSFKRKQPFYISTQKLLPMSRFLPKPPAPKGPKVKRAGGATPRGRGRGRGGFRGRGGGSFRGRGNRGGFRGRR